MAAATNSTSTSVREGKMYRNKSWRGKLFPTSWQLISTTDRDQYGTLSLSTAVTTPCRRPRPDAQEPERAARDHAPLCLSNRTATHGTGTGTDSQRNSRAQRNQGACTLH